MKTKKITHSSIFHNYFKRRMMHCIHGLDRTWKCRCLLFVAWFFFRWFAKYWKYRIKIFIICWDSIDHIRKTYAKFGVWIVPFLRNMNLSIENVTTAAERNWIHSIRVGEKQNSCWNIDNLVEIARSSFARYLMAPIFDNKSIEENGRTVTNMRNITHTSILNCCDLVLII